MLQLALDTRSSRLRASERVSPAIGCSGGAGGRYDDAAVVPEAYNDDVMSCGFCASSSLSSSSCSSASSPPRSGSRSSCQWRSSAYHTTTLYTVTASTTVVSSSTIATYALAPPSLGARWLAALTRHSAASSTKLTACITVRMAERIMFVKATTPAPASSTAAMQKYWTWQPPTGGCTAAIRHTTHSTDSWNTHQYTWLPLMFVSMPPYIRCCAAGCQYPTGYSRRSCSGFLENCQYLVKLAPTWRAMK
ncbi:hypothetical protein ECC02_001446 [Trypanosoma cruzi]|uniref:Uncharacterized protein n=1 Tax=Trypanosoma cruzi TaxID=5693 RepID=A0A7J6YF12_TRYCR|nr:hypothetical protein ECC02_001446 [Trypanosoma cruzi]